MSANATLFYGYYLKTSAEDLVERWTKLCAKANINIEDWEEDDFDLWEKLVAKADKRKIDLHLYTSYPDDGNFFMLGVKRTMQEGGSSEYSNEEPTAIDLTKLTVTQADNNVLDSVIAALELNTKDLSPRGWWLTAETFQDT